MQEVFKVFNFLGVAAVQVTYDVIRVSFLTDEGFQRAKELTGVRLFGLWCPILGGGPQSPWFTFLIIPMRKIIPMFLQSLKILVMLIMLKTKLICQIVAFILALALFSWFLIALLRERCKLMDIFVVFGIGANL